MKLRLAMFCVALTTPSLAKADFVLHLPIGAKTTYSELETTIPNTVPVGPFINGAFPTATAPKSIHRTVWVINGPQPITEVYAGITAQLKRSGYEKILSCVSRECGGYDFRFAIDVVDEPMMRVDLRDYHFITAKQAAADSPTYVTFLLSKSPLSLYLQITEYRPANNPSKIMAEFSIVLEGLTFETGSVAIGADPNEAVAALAKKLKIEKNLRVLLVGHSDMSGSLEGNTTISQRRAEAVRSVLINDHGIAPERLEAHGVGYLSPRATNETKEGAQKNRRVEAIFSK